MHRNVRKTGRRETGKGRNTMRTRARGAIQSSGISQVPIQRKALLRFPSRHHPPHRSQDPTSYREQDRGKRSTRSGILVGRALILKLLKLLLRAFSPVGNTDFFHLIIPVVISSTGTVLLPFVHSCFPNWISIVRAPYYSLVPVPPLPPFPSLPSLCHCGIESLIFSRSLSSPSLPLPS